MVAIRTVLSAAFGALIMLALHFTLSPALDGKCQILCRPERAVLAGVVLGGLVGFFHTLSLRKEERENEQEEGHGKGTR